MAWRRTPVAMCDGNQKGGADRGAALVYSLSQYARSVQVNGCDDGHDRRPPQIGGADADERRVCNRHELQRTDLGPEKIRERQPIRNMSIAQCRNAKYDQVWRKGLQRRSGRREGQPNIGKARTSANAPMTHGHCTDRSSCRESAYRNSPDFL